MPQGRPRHVTRVLEFARDEDMLQGVAGSKLALESPASLARYLPNDGPLSSRRERASDSDEGEGVGSGRSEGGGEEAVGRRSSEGMGGDAVARPVGEEREGRGGQGGDGSDAFRQREEGGGGSECAEEGEEEWRRWEWEHLHPQGVLRYTKEVADAVERCRRLTLSASPCRWTSRRP